MTNKDEKYSAAAIESRLQNLLQEYHLEYYQDKEVIDRILSHLRAGSYNSLQGLIYTTSVAKYGADISKSQASRISTAIEQWWKDPN